MRYVERYALDEFGEPWADLVTRLYQEYQSLAKVADITGISTYTIWTDLKKLGVQLRSPGGANNFTGNLSKTEFQGREQSLKAWAEEYGIKKCTFDSRLYVLGWTLREALLTPVGAKREYI